MLVFIIVQLVGYAGLIAAKRIALATRDTGRVEVATGIWAIITCFALSCSFSYMLVSVMAYSGAFVIGIGISGSVLILLYVCVGLGILWPRSTSLGFPLVGIQGLAIGATVGCVFVTALSPQVWASVMHPPFWFRDYLVVSGVVPMSILEEAVFRGRVMELLSRKIRSPEVTLLAQTLLFTGMHMIYVPLSCSPGGQGIPAILRRLSIIALTAYAYGLLRQRSGGLWAPVGAHITYNVLALLNNMDTIG